MEVKKNPQRRPISFKKILREGQGQSSEDYTIKTNFIQSCLKGMMTLYRFGANSHITHIKTFIFEWKKWWTSPLTISWLVKHKTKYIIFLLKLNNYSFKKYLLLFIVQLWNSNVYNFCFLHLTLVTHKNSLQTWIVNLSL